MSRIHQEEMADADRQGWLSWIFAFSLLLAFAITVYLLYSRLIDGAEASVNSNLWLKSRYYTGIGLAGMVCIFILYTLLRQKQFSLLRRTLLDEEAELKDVRTRLSELSTMFELAATLDVQMPLDSILAIMVRRVVAALKAQQASVMLYDAESGVLETRAYYGVEGEFSSKGRRRLGEGIAGRVAELQTAMILPGDESSVEFKQFYKPHRNISSALCVPLQVEEICVGVLNVNRIGHPTPFTQHQQDVLRIFAEHVGAVVQRAEAMDQLGQRAQNLELDNARLSEMNRMKDVFLSTASHELKTPLTTIIGYAELLNDHEESMNRDQRLEFTQRLRVEASQLMRLIEDILDLTRLETGKIKLRRETISLNEIVKTAVSTTQPMAGKNQVTLVEELDNNPLEMVLDPVKMRQVLVNLITNAIKFSPQGGEVKVQTDREGEGAVVKVSDRGPGISRKDRSQIFALFGQASRNDTKKTAGVGIGLHLVKRIVELHGGKVGVDTHEGQGSTFWVHLPISSSEANPSQAA